jgi:hypothetical protein
LLDFDLHGLSPEEIERLNAEWLAICALRDTLDVAYKGNQTPTYQSVLDIGERLAPEFFSHRLSILRRLQGDAEIREYEQRAAAQSALTNQPVRAIDVIEREIAECKAQLGTAGPRDQLARRLKRLERIRSRVIEDVMSENKLLLHDMYKAERPNLPSMPVGDLGFRMFRLPDKKILRLRLLHPERPEHSTGADMIYEMCAPRENLVKVAFVQYKAWNGKALYASKSRNLERQVSRLSDLACKSGLCAPNNGDEPHHGFRLPHCAAFLRPTDRLQPRTLRSVSRGFHVPVCIARELLAVDGTLRARDLRGRALSGRVFEELFSQSLAGSRWLPYADVEKLYSQHGVIDLEERILVHAQEFEDSLRDDDDDWP